MDIDLWGLFLSEGFMLLLNLMGICMFAFFSLYTEGVLLCSSAMTIIYTPFLISV